MNKKLSTAIFGLLLAASLSAPRSRAQMQVSDIRGALPAAASQAGTVSPTNVDLRALRAQLDAFENVLNRGVQENFGQPFALLQDAKGIYLPGYGVAFHMEINLATLRMQSPFDLRPYTAEEIQKAKDGKIAGIHTLKTRLSALLLERGGTLTAMAPDQNIAVVVHLFKLPAESRDLPTQLVISVNRQMLLDYQARRMTAEQFENAVSIFEF